MNMEQIKAIAKANNVKPGKMRKAELVRAIQTAEGNLPCFDTQVAGRCPEQECLWREDCA